MPNLRNNVRVTKRTALASEWANMNMVDLTTAFNESKRQFLVLKMLMKIRTEEQPEQEESLIIDDEDSQEEALIVAEEDSQQEALIVAEEDSQHSQQEEALITESIPHSQQEALIIQTPTPPQPQPERNIMNDDDTHNTCPVCCDCLGNGFATCPNNHPICFRCFMHDTITSCPMCRHNYHKPNIDDTPRQLRQSLQEKEEMIELLQEENERLQRELDIYQSGGRGRRRRGR